MALTPRLQQAQSHSLVMTPKLAQSIKLLQLSHVDLMEYVRDEVEKNPLLEIGNRDQPADRRTEKSEVPAADSADNAARSNDIGDHVKGEMTLEAGKKADDLDSSFENVYDEGIAGAEHSAKKQTEPSGNATTSQSSSSATEDIDTIGQLEEMKSLAQHLEFQIAIAFKSESERKIATYIAHALDDDGYFREDMIETAEQLDTDLETLLVVLDRFQTLEPVGVGARNLVECLRIQLRDQNRLDPAMEVFITNLNLLAKREFETLLKLCEVSRDDFNEMVREIKALDPRPAVQFTPVLSETVVPDILIGQKPDGNWSIELNPETLPKVLVNREYHAELSSAIDTDEGKEFISECLGNANWLTKSLDQRAQTILKVAVEIVKQQDAFFAQGIEHLKPLNLQTVADAIKMHESTISRVTSNKYLMCDQGIFELRYFFSSALGGNDGEEVHAAETVKFKIKQLIDAENPKKILSDDKIVALLQDTGIAIARRTVAKYREALRIPSSVQRRREKTTTLA